MRTLDESKVKPCKSLQASEHGSMHQQLVEYFNPSQPKFISPFTMSLLQRIDSRSTAREQCLPAVKTARSGARKITVPSRSQDHGHSYNHSLSAKHQRTRKFKITQNGNKFHCSKF